MIAEVFQKRPTGPNSSHHRLQTAATTYNNAVNEENGYGCAEAKDERRSRLSETDGLSMRPLSLKKKLFFTLVTTVIGGTLALSVAEAIVRYTFNSRYETPWTLKNRTLEYAPEPFA